MTATVAASPSGAVEELGLGRAQRLVLLLSAAGVFLCDGAGLQAMNISSVRVAAHFGVGAAERSLPPTADLLGLLIGTVMAGCVGDVVGRRFPIVAGYGLMFLFGLLSFLAPAFNFLLICRLNLGIGMGLAWPPSLALASELTPTRWRMVVRVLSQFSYPLGQYLVILVVLFDDPMLTDLHWRVILGLYVLLPGTLFALSAAFLGESPVFLAATGRHDAARAELQRLSDVNGVPRVDYEPPRDAEAKEAASPGELSLRQRLGVVCSPRLLGATLTTCLVTFTLNLALYGQMYATQQVLPGRSSLAPGVELVFVGSITLATIVPIYFISNYLPRKAGLVLSFVGSLAATILLRLMLGDPPPRTAVHETLFQVGCVMMPVSILLGFTVVYQVCVEIFPPNVVATGASLCIGCGRVGACLSPLSFEGLHALFDDILAWYYLVIVLQLLCVIALFRTTIQAYSEEHAGKALLSHSRAEQGEEYGATS